MPKTIMSFPLKAAKRIIRDILRFTLRYEWTLKYGKRILQNHPGIQGKLLGLADLANPHVPRRPLISISTSKMIERLPESTQAIYHSLQEIYHHDKINQK